MQHQAVSGNRGNLTSMHQWVNTNGSTLTGTYTYDDTGTMLKAQGPTGTTQIGHDSSDTYITSVTPPTPSSGISLAIQAGNDFSTGLLTSTTDPNGETTGYGYDAMDRVQSVDYPDGGKTVQNFTADQVGLFQYQNANTSTNRQTLYDGFGRISRIADNNGQGGNSWYQNDTCYDGNGRVSFRSNRYQGSGWGTPQVCSGNGDSYSYDILGRVLTITHADGTSRRYTYAGRAVEITDETGVSKITQSDALGRPTAVCEISGNGSMPASGSPSSCGTDVSGTGFLTNYSYNLASHMVTVMQGAQTRVFQTDSLGRLVLAQEPESGVTTYSYAYNSTGLVVTRQRPRANQTSSSVLTTTTTQYDNLGRVVQISYNDGSMTRAYYYDQPNLPGENFSSGAGKGRLIATKAGGYAGGMTLFQYDSMGRVVKTLQCPPKFCLSYTLNKVLDYSYDWLGDMTSAGDASGNMLSYSYSPAGEVTGISQSLSGATYPSVLVSNVQNSPFGPTSYRLGNGLTVVKSYNSLGVNFAGWVCNNGSTAAYCGNTSGPGQTYGYANTVQWHRINDFCDTVLNQCGSLGYDEFGRLSSRTVTAGAVQDFSYVYDRYGNRWQQNAPQGGPAPQLSFNPANNQMTNAGFQYDAAGNLINDGSHSYQYDAEGNLTGVDGGQTASYIYDALNRRTQTTEGGNIVEYFYDLNGRRISTWNGTTNAQIEGQSYWGSMPVEFYSGGSAHFQHQDWEGTERMRTASNGAVEGTYQSLPFGDGFTASGSDSDAYHFAMLDHSYETDTDHAQFRQYENIQGRWMSPDPYNGSYDPANPQSLNRYSYVGNNPLAFVDPSGLYHWVCDASGCTAVGDYNGENIGDGSGGTLTWNSGTGMWGAPSSGGDPSGGNSGSGNSGGFGGGFSGGIVGLGGTSGGSGAGSASGNNNAPNNGKPTCAQTSWAENAVAAGLSSLSSLTGKGFSFGWSVSGTYAAGIGGYASGGQAIVTAANGTAGIETFGGGGVTGGFGGSASMTLDFGISSYGNLNGYGGGSFNFSGSAFEGLGGGATYSGGQSGSQGIIGVGVGGGGAVKVGAGGGVSGAKVVPIC
jgi:RHS repeat-associated protein